jgi:hypothetical protein
MSHLFVDIEALVLDGVPLRAVDGGRLARLTEMALTRLLQQRGITAFDAGDRGLRPDARNPGPMTINAPAGANEVRWAEELALVLYRAMDRTF